MAEDADELVLVVEDDGQLTADDRKTGHGLLKPDRVAAGDRCLARDVQVAGGVADPEGRAVAAHPLRGRGGR